MKNRTTKGLRGWLFVPPEKRNHHPAFKWECVCGCRVRVGVHPDIHPPWFWRFIHLEDVYGHAAQ